MKCPVCRASMVYKGGENQKDFGCSNRMNCSSRSEAHYYPHLSVRPDWYFCEAYHLPFKSGNEWFCVIGPEYDYNISDGFKARTVLQKIVPSISSYNPCSQTTLLSIPYMALPANDDMLEQFNILIERVMGRLAIK